MTVDDYERQLYWRIPYSIPYQARLWAEEIWDEMIERERELN